MKVINFFPKELMDALGWTFMHSIWQGLLLFIVLAMVLVILRRFSASTKYLLCVSFLFFFLASSVATFYTVYDPEIIVLSSVPVIQNVETRKNSFETFDVKDQEKYKSQIAATAIKTPFYTNLGSFFPVVVTFWFLGIILLSIKYLGGWIYVHRLRNKKINAIDEYWESKCKQLGRKLNLSKKYIIRFSSLATTPMVIGFFRPVVLLPIKIITQLPEKQIEAILAHELAHIKRNDYLVNLMQSLMEVIFFYHPAVWLISAKIRTERENCCDDLVVSVTGETVDYAEALVNIGYVEIQNNLSLAFSGNQDNLKERVQRMFTARTLFADFRERLVTIVVIFLGVCSLGWGMLAQSDDRGTLEQPNQLEAKNEELKHEEEVKKENTPVLSVTEDHKDENMISRASSIDHRTSILSRKKESNRLGKGTSDKKNSQRIMKSKVGEKSIDKKSSSLFEAINRGDVEVVKALIKGGADIEIKNKDGETPLLLAVKENKYDIAKFLINNGSDVSFVRKDGRSMLIEAVDEKDLRLTELLLKKGVAIDYKSRQNPPALFEAIDKGKIEIVKILLKEGADIEMKDKKERTALMYALDEGESEIAQLLIKADADVNAQTKDGWTVLMEASVQKYPDIVKMLINRGANVKAISYHNITALNSAVRKGRLEIAKILIGFGADVNWRYDKLTPLCEAVRRNNYAMTKLLVDSGADVQARESDRGETVLIQAADEKDPRIVELLLQNGAHVNATRYDSRTAIFEAIESGKIANAKILIKHGADVNWQNYDDKTPLIYAIEKKKKDMVVLLVENGANTKAKRGNGWSVLQIAERSKNSEIVNYIASQIKN